VGFVVDSVLMGHVFPREIQISHVGIITLKSYILYLVHIRELVSPYQIHINKRTHILFNCHFISTTRNFNMFQHIKIRFQRV